MILQRMFLSMGAATILRNLHPNASKLFKKFNHVSRFVQMIDDGSIDNMKADDDIIEPFETIKSMLCEKISNSNKSLLTCSKSLYQETKMDGERFQLHYKDGEFRYFSRNGHNYSIGFNELITPHIKFTAVVRSLILDGEMMVYDSDTSSYFTKGETSVDVKKMKASNSNLRPCYCAFDILYFNGSSQMSLPYHDRMDILDQLFVDRVGVMVKTKPVKIRSDDMAGHIVELLNKAIEHEEEGIVLKNGNSHYRPGERSGGWYKVKADYIDGLVQDFDCVVIGGYYENFMSKNYIQKYMVGAIEKLEDGKFNIHAIGEVYGGLSKDERENLNGMFKANATAHRGESEVKFDSGTILFGLNKPHVCIPPNKSVVLEIRASELVRTTEQKTSYTFRFPRIQHIRKDKPWDESNTLREFEELYQDQEKSGKVKKLAIRNATANDMLSPTRKRKTGDSKEDLIRKLQQKSRPIREGEILDNVLEGKEFCVKPSVDGLYNVSELQKIITSHGGEIVQHPREGKTFAIVCGHVSNDIKKYIRNKSMNVIKSNWVIRELKSKSLAVMPKLRPKFDLISMTTELMKEIAEIANFYDEFGDSYTDDVETVDELRELLALNPAENVKFRKSEIADLERELDEVCELKNENIFRNLNGHFISNETNQALECSRKLFELFRGNVLKDAGGAQDLVIYDKDEKLESIPKSSKATLIDYNWILDSIDAGKLLDKKLYM